VCAAAMIILVGALSGADASSRTRVVSDCQHAHYKPRTILTCGDGSLYFIHLHWRHWGRHYALATGIARANDCNPYCAAGHFHSYSATLKLTRRGLCGSRGDLEYQRLTLRYTHRKPPGASNPFVFDTYPPC
jgi:hypothetical protein